MGKEKKAPGWVSRGGSGGKKQDRFDKAKSEQQGRIARNNPNAPVEKPKDWTDDDEAAARKRQQEQQDNPPGGRYRHR